MASLTDIPLLRRLMAPTRAAAHRRRRLRKIGSALCVGLAAFIVFGSSHRTTVSPAVPASQKVNLSGLHLISIAADAGIIAAATPGTHVDLWSARGTPIATGLPVARSSSSGGVLGNGSSSTLLVGLTTTQMASYAQVRARTTNDANAILVTLSPK